MAADAPLRSLRVQRASSSHLPRRRGGACPRPLSTQHWPRQPFEGDSAQVPRRFESPMKSSIPQAAGVLKLALPTRERGERVGVRGAEAESRNPEDRPASPAALRVAYRKQQPASSWRASMGSGLYFSELFSQRGFSPRASSLRRSPR